MANKSLIKLIDEAIVPAILLVVAKMIGLFLPSYFLNLEFTVEGNQFLHLLPSVHFTSTHSYLIAENFSNLAMFLAAAAGTAFVLVRAHYFHESHIHPNLHSRLISLNLESLVAPSYHLYHQATIWLIFLWLTVGFLILSSIQGITYPQITIAGFLVAANFSWILSSDIQKEVEITSNS